MIQKAALSLIIISCLLSPALAQNYNPGLIKPDSPLWQLDLQIERLHENIQFDQNTRIELQLQHADERMGELQCNVNVEATANQYNAVLARIQGNERVDYHATEQIQQRMTEHNIALDTMERDGSEQLRALLKTASDSNNIVQTETVTRQEEITSNDLEWWQDFISNYPVQDVPTSALTMLDTDMASVQSYVPAGITQITIIQEDSSTVQEYIIKHTADDILISRGKTTNPAQSYTFTIQDVQQYKKQYGSMVSL